MPCDVSGGQAAHLTGGHLVESQDWTLSFTCCKLAAIWLSFILSTCGTYKLDDEENIKNNKRMRKNMTIDLLLADTARLDQFVPAVLRKGKQLVTNNRRIEILIEISPQWIQSDSCRSCEPPNPADRRLLSFWKVSFLSMIHCLFDIICSHLQPILPGSRRTPWYQIQIWKGYLSSPRERCSTPKWRNKETHFEVHSPWAVWIAAQSTWDLFTRERKPKPEPGKASEPERRARVRSQSFILPKTTLETPPTCVWPFCSWCCKTGKVVLNSEIPKASPDIQ